MFSYCTFPFSLATLLYCFIFFSRFNLSSNKTTVLDLVYQSYYPKCGQSTTPRSHLASLGSIMCMYFPLHLQNTLTFPVLPPLSNAHKWISWYLILISSLTIFLSFSGIYSTAIGTLVLHLGHFHLYS